MTRVHDAAGKRARLIKRQKNRCAICGQQMKAPGTDQMSATLDHIVPRAHGGGGNIENLRAVHRACNMARGTGDPMHRPVRGAGAKP